MSAGRVRVVGLGPGPADWRTPEADAALARASDVLGYAPYLDRLSLAPSQRRHASDNREEIARARHALALAAEGADVALVSGGDPGIFAMAAALIEAAEAGEPVVARARHRGSAGRQRDAGGGGAAGRAARAMISARFRSPTI